MVRLSRLYLNAGGPYSRVPPRVMVAGVSNGMRSGQESSKALAWHDLTRNNGLDAVITP